MCDQMRYHVLYYRWWVLFTGYIFKPIYHQTSMMEATGQFCRQLRKKYKKGKGSFTEIVCAYGTVSIFCSVFKWCILNPVP